jgi:UDP:flavonoid glycosyltransferase YjiC (YdhE family)
MLGFKSFWSAAITIAGIEIMHMNRKVKCVTAGMTEDKADVNARVAWSGVGIDLQTHQPTAAALRTAVRTVLDTPTYRRKAVAIGREMGAIDTRFTVLRIIAEVTDQASAVAHWRTA